MNDTVKVFLTLGAIIAAAFGSQIAAGVKALLVSVPRPSKADPPAPVFTGGDVPSRQIGRAHV